MGFVRRQVGGEKNIRVTGVQKVGHGTGRVGAHAFDFVGGPVVQSFHRVPDRDLAGMVQSFHGFAGNFRRAGFERFAQLPGLHPGQQGQQDQRQDLDDSEKTDQLGAHAEAEVRQLFFQTYYQRNFCHSYYALLPLL